MRTFHGTDLRKGRRSLPGQAYLLTTVTRERKPVLADFSLARLVVAELKRSDTERLTETLAFVVMPDHLHWLVVLRDGDLPGVMRRVKSRSAAAAGRALGCRVLLWQRGYHDHAVRRGEDLRNLGRYVVGNPLRAGLVDDLGQYPLWDAAWV